MIEYVCRNANVYASKFRNRKGTDEKYNNPLHQVIPCKDCFDIFSFKTVLDLQNLCDLSIVYHLYKVSGQSYNSIYSIPPWKFDLKLQLTYYRKTPWTAYTEIAVMIAE